MRFVVAMVALVLCACEDEAAETAEAIFTPARRAIDHAAPAPEVKTVRPSGDVPAGYVAMTPSARSGEFGNVVLLQHPESDVVVPIFVGGTEALSIELRLGETPFRRPLTHDLLDAFAKEVGARLVRSQVNALVEDVFVGSVVFEQGGKLIELDARPSDAIALAVGNHVPIYVSQSVIDKAGVHTRDMDRSRPAPHAEPVAL